MANPSLSNVSNDFLKTRIGIDLDTIKMERTEFNKMLTIIRSPINLKLEIYHVIEQYLKTVRFFDYTSKECKVDDLMINIIPRISYYLKSEHNVKNLDVERELDIYGHYEMTDGEIEMIKRRVEIIFLGHEDRETELDQFLLKPFLVIENKRISNSLNSGLNQCVLTLKAMHDYNKEHTIIYGIVNTCLEWMLVKYDGQKFVISKNENFILNGFKDRKEAFMKEINLVDVLYSLLINFLKLDSKN